MANVTLSIPDSILPDLEAALRERMGDAATGQTRRAVFALWVKQGIRPIVLAYRRRTAMAPLVAIEESARIAAEATLATERRARSLAEQAIETTLTAEVEGIS